MNTPLPLPTLNVNLEKLVSEIITLNEIPAPTFAETAKALYVKKRFEEIGLITPHIDKVGNVLGYLPGTDPAASDIVLTAHLDTVFPLEMDVRVKRENGRLYGPGVGDNNLAIAALLELATFLKNLPNQPRHKLVFAATVGEEGLGDLNGVRELMAAYQTANRQPALLIALEGHGLADICHAGVGNRRMEVTVRGPGGHSWARAGQPSAIHGLATLMHRLTEQPVPTQPPTSFNIGTIKGGTSVNTIAPDATMVFEVRSVDETTLTETFARMLAQIETFKVDGLQIETKLVGSRPAGSIPASSPLVKLCQEVYEKMGFVPQYTPKSTDANIPLKMGIPAICLGISNGANAHRIDEWIEIEPARQGIQAALEITYRLAY